MIRWLLFRAKKEIMLRDWLLTLLLPLVTVYRQMLVRFGSNTHTLTVGETTATFRIETHEEARHFYPAFGERDTLSDLLDSLNPGDIFYDIGAHVGIYSCMVGIALGEEAVVSFEPHPANTARLRENLTLNGLNIDVYEVALSDSSGELEFGIESNQPGALGHVKGERFREHVNVDMKRGEMVVSEENLPLPVVIKLDIEGAELKALRGLESVLSECRLIYCEVSDGLIRYGDSEAELLAFFEDHGFSIIRMEEAPDHYNVKAIREP